MLKITKRAAVLLLCLAMLVSVITVPAFAAENSALSSLAGQDLSAFIDLLNKYNSVKDDADAAEQLKEYVNEKYESDASFKESADEILGGADKEDTMSKFDTVIDDVLVNDEYVGDIDAVVDAVQNGATFEEIQESIEYQKAKEMFNTSGSRYGSTYYGEPRRGRNSSDDACDCCMNLICLDCLCECLGGDLIRCI